MVQGQAIRRIWRASWAIAFIVLLSLLARARTAEAAGLDVDTDIDVTLYRLAPLAPDADPSDISFELRSGTTAWLDSNKACAPDFDGPHSLWIEVAATNTSTETLHDVVADLSGLTGDAFELTADPVRYAGTLSPGQTFYTFWYVDYTGACTTAGGPFGIADTFTATVSSPDLTGDATYVDALTTDDTTSAASGSVVTTTNSSDIAIGQVFTQTATYQYGGSRKDVPLFIQPTGDSDFDDACFRLVGAEVTSSEVSGVPTGVTNTLYFASVSHDNGDIIEVDYYWQATCKAATPSTPWTEVGTGNQAKYSKDYGVVFTTLPTGTFSLDVEMSVTPTLLTSGGVVTYTIRVSNSFPRPVILDGLTDTLPANVAHGHTTTASDIDSGNSSVHPTSGSTGTLVWRGEPLVSYSVPASGTVSAGEPGSIALVYTATVPDADGTYTSWVTGTVGNMDTDPISATFELDQPTAVELSTFSAAATETAQGDRILVTWETATELDSLGFNLYRSDAPGGEYVRLNETLIPSQAPGSISGAVYTWLDEGVRPGQTYTYKLEDVDIHGQRTLHGPASVTLAASPSRTHVVYLPFVAGEGGS